MRPSDEMNLGQPDRTQGLPAYHFGQISPQIGMKGLRMELVCRLHSQRNLVIIRIGRKSLSFPQMIHENGICILLEQDDHPSISLPDCQSLILDISFMF